MLRISKSNGQRGNTLRLEGKLVGEWVAEARGAWLEMADGTQLTIDLLDVSFVDDAGRELLAEMHAAGAKLTGRGPMISALIEEIAGEGQVSSHGLAPQLLLLLIGFLKTLSLYKFNS